MSEAATCVVKVRNLATYVHEGRRRQIRCGDYELTPGVQGYLRFSRPATRTFEIPIHDVLVYVASKVMQVVRGEMPG